MPEDTLPEGALPEGGVQMPPAPPESAPPESAPPEPGRRPRRWPTVLTVLIALLLPVAAAVVVLDPGWLHRQPPPTQFGDVPDKLRGQLSGEVVPVLENAPQIEHLGHDEDSTGPRRVMCTVDPFGFDPPGATTAAQVQWVYALHLCVIGEPGLPWEYATKSSGPVAVGLGASPVVRLPQPRLDYRTQVREMIPARYQSEAFGTFGHPELIAALRQRYTTQVASAPPASTTS